jgi:predicted GNAT family N-acyltransferase
MEFRAITQPSERNALMQLRYDVFVLEQNVPEEEEYDAYDNTCAHFGLFHKSHLIGCARVVNLNGVAKIGRVVVAKEHRGSGVGTELMRRLLDWCRAQGYEQAILDSQTYVQEFYAKLGFIPEGEVFLDAGIPHIRMRLFLTHKSP